VVRLGKWGAHYRCALHPLVTDHPLMHLRTRSSVEITKAACIVIMLIKLA
jgi:hypothetical protein